MSTVCLRLAPPILALAMSALTAGCAGISRPSDLRPASHPLLEGVAPRTRLLPLARRASAAPRSASRARPAARPTPTAETRPAPRSGLHPTAESPAAPAQRDTVLKRLSTLDGERRIGERPASDMRLVEAAFGDIDGVRDPGSTLATTRRAGRVVDRPLPGDVAFFDGAGGAAEVAIVRKVRADGAIEAVAVTRGAVRTIVIHPDDPHARRRSGRIINTFLRTRRPDDEPSAVYLAGQLLIDFRTLID